MAENPNSSRFNNIEMNATAYDATQVSTVGQLNPIEVKIADHIKPILEKWQKLPLPELSRFLKTGNPRNTLAYWQGRKKEITQIHQWLADHNTSLVGIQGIGGIGKSTLAAKIYAEFEGFSKRFWGDVSYGAGFSDLARQALTEFGFPIPEQEALLLKALMKCLQQGEYLLIIDNLDGLLQPNRQWASQLYGDFFSAWVKYSGRSKVLVTTREKPELQGFQWLSLYGLQVEDGAALLAESGIKGNLTEFVKLVDGHPLLLRLVADLLTEEYPQDPNLARLADLDLGHLPQLLTDSLISRQYQRVNVGMVSVLDASFARLSELQKALLLNLSVYRGSIDVSAAAAVFSGISQFDIEGELRNFVKRSLLLETLNHQQFEFHPVVLDYLRYKAGEQTAVHQQAINYYLLNAKQKPWQTKENIKEYLEVLYHWYQLENYDSAFNILK
ncbi:NB-ARC domain-containing protein, partial [Aetokthonos hydrillicola]